MTNGPSRQGSVSSRKPVTTGSGGEYGELFSEERNRGAALLIIAISIATPLLCSLLPSGGDGGVYAMAFMLTAGLAGVVYGVYYLFVTFRCYRLGVQYVTPLGTTGLLFRDATKVTYEARHRYHKGIYTGTEVHLTLESEPQRKKVKGYSRKLSQDHPTMEMARDTAAAAMLPLARARLSRGLPFAWTDGAEIRREGIRVWVPSLFSGSWHIEPWSPALETQISDGSCKLVGLREPIATLSCSGVNFYPGLLLFNEIMERGLPEAATRLPKPSPGRVSSSA